MGQNKIKTSLVRMKVPKEIYSDFWSSTFISSYHSCLSSYLYTIYHDKLPVFHDNYGGLELIQEVLDFMFIRRTALVSLGANVKIVQ